MIRSDTIARLVLTLLWTYLLFMGATFNGVLIPGLSFFTLIVCGALLVMWVAIRWRGRWRWNPTPLDGVIILWGVAFVVSLLANSETWRRTFIGLWFVGVYIGVWYVLSDAIQNRAIKRNMMVDALLMSGAVVIGLGFYQFSIVEYDLSGGDIPRIGSTIGNPNALGVYLVMVLMLAAGRFLGQRDRIARLVLGIYILCALVLLILTFSRGPFISMVLASAVFGWLVLQARGTTSFSQMRSWWQQRSARFKLGFVAISIVILMGFLLFAALLLWQTLTDTSRRLDLRGGIYDAGLTAFSEKPLTGHGLFMFGQELSRLQSQPENQPHSHAHNGVIHIAAELGLPGLVALLVSSVATVQSIRRSWQQTPDRMGLAGAASAVAGFGFVHLLDMPAMMPVIALMGMDVLALAVVPHQQIIRATHASPLPYRYVRLVPYVVVSLWTVLIASGIWSTSLYSQYYDIMRESIMEEAYRAGADRLQGIVHADPNLSLYRSQQAYLYGMAAYEGDTEALAPGIAAYERYLELEPQDAVAWTNLGALYWQDDQQQRAVDALERAYELAPKSWQIRFQLGMYAELAGNWAQAIAVYKRHVGNTYNLMYTDWKDTAFRQDFAVRVKPVSIALIVLRLDGDPRYSDYDMDILWQRSKLDKEQSTQRYILQLLLALDSDDPERYSDQFDSWMAQAQRESAGYEDQAWIHIGRAGILRYSGDQSGAEAELEEARSLIAPDFSKADYKNGVNIAHFQFLRYAVVRQFLPQVNYPTIETLPMLRLLD